MSDSDNNVDAEAEDDISEQLEFEDPSGSATYVGDEACRCDRERD